MQITTSGLYKRKLTRSDSIFLAAVRGLLGAGGVGIENGSRDGVEALTLLLAMVAREAKLSTGFYMVGTDGVVLAVLMTFLAVVAEEANVLQVSDGYMVGTAFGFTSNFDTRPIWHDIHLVWQSGKKCPQHNLLAFVGLFQSFRARLTNCFHTFLVTVSLGNSCNVLLLMVFEFRLLEICEKWRNYLHWFIELTSRSAIS